MCISLWLRVKKVVGTTLTMEDGRKISQSNIENIVPGDVLEIYADLVLRKIDTQEYKNRRTLLAQT